MSEINSIIRSGYHHPTLRKLQCSQKLTKEMLSYPIFITDKPNTKQEIKSLPGQFRWSVDRIEELLSPLIKKGLKSVVIFGVPQSITKDSQGTKADDPHGPVIQSIKKIKSLFPNLLIFCDVCLCAYTSSGHCGIQYEDKTIDSVKTNVRLSQVSVSYIKAGADGLVPSDMMDGRIKAIKEALIKVNLAHRATIISMSSKFCSAFYGPFRDAVQTSSEFGNRKTYQLPPGSRSLAIRATIRDHNEGADFLLIKPMLPYLDMIRETQLLYPYVPIATYQVSGEYSMIYHASKHGVFTLKDGVMESIEGALRAGATLIMTYFTPHILSWIDEETLVSKL